MSVLDDCAIAREFPGVHVMHDATEYGLWGGLFEMAQAGNFGMNIFYANIHVQPVIQKTAELFAFDPFSAISEGTLILTVDPKESSDLVKAFEEKGIISSIIGEVIPESKGMKIQKNGTEQTLEFPKADPYWILAAELSK